jgi:hypothetical protein
MTITAAPAAAVTGEVGTISLAFDQLIPGVKYLGSVPYTLSIGGAPAPTMVRVDP